MDWCLADCCRRRIRYPRPGVHSQTTQRAFRKSGTLNTAHRSSGAPPMKQLYPWCAVILIVLTSTTGDVLLSRAMKQVGDVHALLSNKGLFAVFRRIFTNPVFFLGILA